MSRVCVYPEGHWALPVETPYSTGVRERDLIVLGGQVAMDPGGTVLHPDNVSDQIEGALDRVESILGEMDAALSDARQLVLYYVTDGTVDETRFQQQIAERFGTTVPATLSLVPLPYMAYPGLSAEIDIYAMRGEDGSALDWQTVGENAGFPLAVRCGDLIFIGGLTAHDDNGVIRYPDDPGAQSEVIVEKMRELLKGFGAEPSDAVRLNTWYRADNPPEVWEAGVRVRAAFFPEPGPVSTAIPVHTLQPPGAAIAMSMWAMRGRAGEKLARRHAWPEGHWDWPIHLPFKHGLECGGLLFVGGQVSMDAEANVLDPDDMNAQTVRSMDNIGRVLKGLNADYQDIVKVNAYFEGGRSTEVFHENLTIRNRYFTRPGPASTGAPFNRLGVDNMVVEIEAIGVRRESPQ